MKYVLALVAGASLSAVAACAGPGGTPLSAVGAPTAPSSLGTPDGAPSTLDSEDRAAACDRYAGQLRQAIENGRITAREARRLYNARCGETTSSR